MKLNYKNFKIIVHFKFLKAHEHINYTEYLLHIKCKNDDMFLF